MLRKIFLSIAIVLVLLLVALLILPGLVDSRKLLDPLLAEVEKSSGVVLRVNGAASLRVIPRLAVALEDITVQLPEEDAPSVGAARFDLGLRLLPLLSGRVEVERFGLRQVVSMDRGDDGEPNASLDIEGLFDFEQSSQRLNLSDVEATLRGLTPEPVKLSLSGPVDLAAMSADITLALQQGEIKGDGTVRYAAQESPQVDAKLHLNRFSPALYALAGPDAAVQADETTADTGEAQALPLEAIRAMDTRAELRIDEVIWEGHTIRELKAKLRVVDGNVIVPELSGDIHGGKLLMKANLNAAPAVPRINTSGTLTGIDIASLLAALEIEPAMTGRATLDWDLRGQGDGGDAIRDSLRGPIHLTTQDAVLTVAGVERELCQLVASANREQLAVELPETSSFEQLSATIQVAGGKARLQPLTARLPQMGLTGKGELELASQDFEALFNAQLSPGLAQLDPACRVNERLTAIKWPVECEGNLGGEPKEWCSIDSREILEDLGGNELKRKAQQEVEKRFGKDAGDTLRNLLGK